MITISSSSLLIDIEQNFKVSAGPGAGKTYWLTQHIQNVLSRSQRLKKSRKIACITYTNIAVETILRRIGTQSLDDVEVSTIHSFLYRHIIKPYVHHIAHKYDLDISKLQGHKDIKPSYGKVKRWLENNPQELKHPHTVQQLINLPHNRDALFNWLSRIKYEFERETLTLKGCEDDGRQIRKIVNQLENNLFSYKKLFWEEGRLSHDDVLFFSLELIREFPFILQVLRAKFPYFFIDEFQDTSPIQTKIISLLTTEETVVGVIGDPAQSIYSFQGADLNDFLEFKSNDISEFMINENRRSSEDIVRILNYMREDIKQISFKKTLPSKPIIITGDYSQSYKHIKKSCTHQDSLIHTLTRDNITSNAMSLNINDSVKTNLVNTFSNVDSPSRFNIIKTSIESLELSNKGYFKDAIKLMSQNFPELSEKEQIRYSIATLQILLKNREELLEKTLLEFSEFLGTSITFPKVSRGKVKKFYEENTYQYIAAAIGSPISSDYYRTIHSSKGDEFDTVFLVANNLDFLIDTNLDEDEEDRVFYVAISRAINNLIISVPRISDTEVTALERMFNIIKCD